MYEFLWYGFLLLLPLPLLVYWLAPPTQKQDSVALKVPFLHELSDEHVVLTRQWRHRLSLMMAVALWIMLVLAAARPVHIGEEISMPISGRDLMLAVDLSGSMDERDFEINGKLVNRLTATKYIAGDFIEKRKGDRLGLVLFGDQAYLQVPLTFDRRTVRKLLYESALKLAGERTAIGDAIGLSLKRLKDQAGDQKVLILMTDGANTAGNVSPLAAAEMAANAGLKIYTVGIGSEQGSRRGMGFFLMNPSAELDERMLKAIADKTGGSYFRARSTAEFQRIYSELDRLEPVSQEEEKWRPQKELFYLPLALALGFAFLMLLLRQGEE